MSGGKNIAQFHSRNSRDLAGERGNAQQVQAAPHQPRDEARQLEPEDFRHRLVVADGGKLALGAIAERPASDAR